MNQLQPIVDESVCNVINITLSKMGVNRRIEELFESDSEIKALRGQISELHGQISYLKNSIGSTGSALTLDCKIEERDISSVFPFLAGASTVPYFTWDSLNLDVPTVNPNYYIDRKAVCGILNGITAKADTWLYGPTGCGKDEAVKFVASKLHLPLITVSFDGDISRTDLIGRDHLKVNDQGATYSEFMESVLPKALRQPCILLLDEFDFIREDVAYVMQTVLNEGRLNILEKDGETIIRHPHCYVVATANTNGKYDDMNRYGARELSSAVLDRFTNWVKMDYMSEQEYVALMEKSNQANITTDNLKEFARLIKDYQTLFVNGDAITPLTNRTILSTIKRATSYEDVYDVLNYTFRNRLSQYDDDKVAELIEKVIGAK